MVESVALQFGDLVDIALDGVLEHFSDKFWRHPSQNLIILSNVRHICCSVPGHCRVAII